MPPAIPEFRKAVEQDDGLAVFRSGDDGVQTNAIRVDEVFLVHVQCSPLSFYALSTRASALWAREPPISTSVKAPNPNTRCNSSISQCGSLSPASQFTWPMPTIGRR